MKNILIICLSIFFVNIIVYSQTKSSTEISNIQTIDIQKKKASWNIQFMDTAKFKCTNPIGIVCDGNYFYTGSKSKPIIYKFDFNYQIVDSFDISGMPSLKESKIQACMTGLTYDGTYFYMVHGTDTIYQIDLVTRNVVAIIPLYSGTAPLGITYAPDVDSGNGGFWVTVYGTYILKLFSRHGILLETISNYDFNYNGESYFWELAYDMISNEEPFIYCIEYQSKNIFHINLNTKKISDPLHCINEDIPNLINYEPLGIYLQKGIIENTTTLGFFIENNIHLGYDLASSELPELGIGIENTNMKTYYKVGEPITISVNAYRTGKKIITSYDYNYSIKGIAYSQSITCDSICEVYPRITLYHGTTFVPDSILTYEIKIWFSNLNGNTTISSDTFNFSFVTYTNAVQRKVLHEIFTSSTCGTCKFANQKILQIFNENEDKYACIKYHMNFPGTGDPYFIHEGNDRKNYYLLEGIPYMAVDGKYYNGNPNLYSSALLNTEYNEPAFVDFNAIFKYDSAKKFTTSITVMPLKDYKGSNRLFVALVEKETIKNIKTNGETEFYYVFKKFMTNSQGDSVTLIKNKDTVYNYSYEFKGEYRLPENGLEASINDSIEHSVEEFYNIMAVYWIQNYSTKEVLQAGWVDAATSMINQNQNTETKIIIYPNPSHGNITISSSSPINTVKVFNLLGQEITVIHNVVSNECNISTIAYKSGFYLVQIDTKDGVITRKLNVR